MSRASRKGKPVRPNRRLWNLGQRSQGRSRRFKRFDWLRKFPFKLFLEHCWSVFPVRNFHAAPIFSIFSLDTKNPKETALMQQRKEEAKDKGKTLRIDYRWVPLSKIPKHVSEWPYWWRKMVRSIRMPAWIGMKSGNLSKPTWSKGRIVRGGSTITQQLAKNLYLSTSRDPIRKLKELLITWMLEARLTKKRILELYLNIIEWGPGMFGIEAGSPTPFS